MISNLVGTFIGRFPSDGAASMAVKGLNIEQRLYGMITLSVLRLVG